MLLGLHFIIIAFLANGANTFTFSSDYLGVVFSPYGKISDSGSYPSWSNYTFDEVQVLLELISTRFKNISTYGMGTASVDAESWNEGDSVGFTGVAAANVNKKKGKTVLSTSLAVWGFEDFRLDTEIKIAFQVAEEANKIHPGTVWSITLTTHYAKDIPSTERLLEYVSKAREISKTLQQQEVPLQLGIRLDSCEKFYNPNENVRFLHELIKSIDYVICFKIPDGWAGRGGVDYTIRNMANIFKQTRIAMQRINPNISVIYETGWPSTGINQQGLPTSIENLKDYWQQLSIWGEETKFPIHMFEVLDQPWKITHDIANQNRSSAIGICGSESHYGWWRRKDNWDMTKAAYVEKITEPQLPACDEIEENNGTYLAISLSVIVVILVALVISMYFRLRAAKNESLTEKDIEEFEKGLFLADGDDLQFEDALRLPYDRSFELEKSKFNIDRTRILGRGAFGVVYKGKIIENNMTAAFKTTKPQCPTENLKNLLTEIKLMIYIGKHPNIVCLLGAYTGEIRKGGVFIASEYCASGSLESVLSSIADGIQSNYGNAVGGTSQYENANVTSERYVNNPGGITRPESLTDPSIHIFSMDNLKKWAHDIANGMVHLSERKVIHADLAARNVLISGDGTAKITDFGLSKKLYAYTEYVKKNEEPLPWRWLAIESLQRLAFSSESDVWSYGVTLWEIFSLGEVPYPGLAWNINFVDHLKGGLRLKKPTHASDKIYAEMLKCWMPEPKERPNFYELSSFWQGTFTTDC